MLELIKYASIYHACSQEPELAYFIRLSCCYRLVVGCTAQAVFMTYGCCEVRLSTATWHCVSPLQLLFSSCLYHLDFVVCFLLLYILPSLCWFALAALVTDLLVVLEQLISTTCDSSSRATSCAAPAPPPPDVLMCSSCTALPGPRSMR